MGLLSLYTGNEDTWSIVPQGEGQEDNKEAKEVQTLARGMQGAGDACISGDADKWVHADPPSTWEDAGLPMLPEGYKVNRGAAYYPLEITSVDGSKQIADFIKIKWCNNPVVCECPIHTYSPTDLELLQEDHVLSKDIDDTVEWISDVGLKVELQCFRYEGSRLDYLHHEKEQIATEEWKLELAHAGTACHLSGADFFGRARRANWGRFADLMDKYKCQWGWLKLKRG